MATNGNYFAILYIVVGIGKCIWKKLIEIQQQTFYLTQLVNKQLSTCQTLDNRNKGSLSLPEDVHGPLNCVQDLESLEEKLKTFSVR